jgi:mannitol operon transcriptional antiterminator
MEFSSRQRAALEILLRGGKGELTLGQIAAKVGVSGRTIHRELARIAPALLSSYGLVLSGKSGQGLRILGSPERIGACLAELERTRPSELAPEERRRILAALFLEAEGVVKLFSLEADLGEGGAVVRRDLEELRPWLEAGNLALRLRRGIGVVLEGTEWAKRQAICALFMEEFGEAGILGLLGGAGDEGQDGEGRLRGLLLRIVPPGLLRAAEAILSGLPRELRLSLAPRDYLGLVVHLAVGSERRRRSFLLDLPADFPDEEAAEASKSPIAGLIALGMSRAAGLPDDLSERVAVHSYLRGAKPERRGSDLLGDFDMASLAALQDLVLACGELYGADFSEDPLLRDGLAAHWGPVLYRLRARLPIRNPLLGQIRRDYAGLFDAIRAAADRVFPGLKLPDDEIAYLVLHFGSSLERRAKAGRRFRALIVCSAGIGSAQMLASRIHAELPEIDIVASLSWFDAGTIARDDWDILVSTIPLPLASEEYILVSPLLPAEGAAALRVFLEKRRDRIRAAEVRGAAGAKKMAGLEPRPSRGDQSEGASALEAHAGGDRDPLGRLREEGEEDFPVGEASESRFAKAKASGLGDLKEMSAHLGAAIAVLEGFCVLRAPPAQGGWEAFLASAVARCAEAGALSDPALVLRDLELRSRDRGMILPGSSILFLHARSAGLGRAFLSLHILASPLAAEGKAWERRPTRLILMLAPQGLDRATQDILNEISSSLLDPGALEVLETGDEVAIRSFYSRHLDRYSRMASNQGV